MKRFIMKKLLNTDFIDARECIARGHNLMKQYCKQKGTMA